MCICAIWDIKAQSRNRQRTEEREKKRTDKLRFFIGNNEKYDENNFLQLEFWSKCSAYLKAKHITCRLLQNKLTILCGCSTNYSEYERALVSTRVCVCEKECQYILIYISWTL